MRTKATAAAAAVALVLLAGCDPGEGGWRGPVPPQTPGVERVAVQGDSLVDCCDDEWLADPLAAVHPLALWSVGATRLGNGEWFRDLTPRPHVAVIAQGANNARVGWGADDRAYQRSTLAAVADVPCVVIVDMGWDPRATPTLQQGMADGNAEWERFVAADPDRLSLAGWQAASSERPEWFLRDGMHHTPAGETAYRRVITDAVDAALAGGCARS